MFYSLFIVIKEKKPKFIEIKNQEIMYFKVYVKRRNFPFDIKFSEVKGEAMLFYSNDEINQYPSMD